MPIAEDNERLQTVVRRETAEKIREYAQRMEVSESKMICYLLEAAIEDNDWVIRAATSGFAKRLAKAFGVKKKGTRGGRVASDKAG